MADYRVIADRIAADVASGRLPPGTRLPPQRRFARQHGIATSTAGRVYGELVRRGVAVGEVGRGTFVRAAPRPADPALAEPGRHLSMDLNFPAVPEQPDLLASGLRRMLRPETFAAALRPVGTAGTPAAREATASLLTRAGWAPDPRDVLFAGNGRQAIATAIAALVPPGGRLGVESLTYPVVKGIASRLGVTLVPLPTDDVGLLPDALDAVPELAAVYLQPTLHNPLSASLPDDRRAALADALRRHDLVAVEDTVYAYLRPDRPPLATLAPERVVVVDSLSKRLGPGLSVGFVVPPRRLVQDVAAALRTGAWTVQRFALDAATGWIADGAVAEVEALKRRDAEARQRLVARHLAGLDVRGDPRSYHCWWQLPPPWRADTFVAAAARQGIAVTPAGAFAVHPGHEPNAVRLALASPAPDELDTILRDLAELARGGPDDTVE